jgi:hypothetical protein
MIVAYAVGNDAHATAHAGDRLDLRLRRLEAGEDSISVLHECPAGGREPDRPRAAFDERHTCLALERGDLLGYSRRREGERLGGRGDGAALGDLPEDAHAPDVQHKPSLTHDQGRSVAMMLGSWQRSPR